MRITLDEKATKKLRTFAMICKAKRMIQSAEDKMIAGQCTPNFYKQVCKMAAELAYDAEDYDLAAAIAKSAGIRMK